jgi:hypothetical protein
MVSFRTQIKTCAMIYLFQSVTTKDVTSGKVTKAAEKAQNKK